MSTQTGGSLSPSVALVTPPSDVDYGASIASLLHDSSSQLTTTRYDPTSEATLPTADDADLVIVTGSTARVLDDAPWIDRLATHLRLLVDAGTPVLGVCYGHQLLAASLGGTVDTLETRAAGYRKITITPPGQDHPLLDGLPHQFTSFLWHRDHVTTLPPDAIVLARKGTGIQAFACQDRPAFGIQFHPEVGIADARTLTATASPSAVPPDIEDTLSEGAASRAARARRIYDNALLATKPQNSHV